MTKWTNGPRKALNLFDVPGPTCPECGQAVACYECASRGGWAPAPDEHPVNDEPPHAD